MKQLILASLLWLSVGGGGSVGAQVPQRDEAYWKAQQNVEFTRSNAIAAQERFKAAERALQEAITAREAAENQLDKTKQKEADARKALPVLSERHQAAVRAWQDAKTEFENI